MALPMGEENRTVNLSEEEGELADVTSMYAKAARLDPSVDALGGAGADVIHIAGHTERMPGRGDDALLFRGGPVAWSRIAEMKLARPVIVLAACDTLRAPPYPRTHALSLGGGFVAGGAAAVIGTLAPIPDNESRVIFRAIHRELARGRGAARSLQQALIQAISDEPHSGRSAWKDVALLTTRIE
jgi:CHAT domain-containing protein